MIQGIALGKMKGVVQTYACEDEKEPRENPLLHAKVRQQMRNRRASMEEVLTRIMYKGSLMIVWRGPMTAIYALAGNKHAPRTRGGVGAEL